MMTQTTLTATSIAVATDFEGALRGVLIIGPSGVGKSDLALRLIAECPFQRTILIADDRTRVERKDERLFLSAPARIKGLLEVRGIGILKVPQRDHVEAALVIKALGEETSPARLPDNQRHEIAGEKLPEIALNPSHASAPAKIRAALAYPPSSC